MKNVLEHGSKWTREPGVLFRCQMCDCFFEASESSYTSIAQTNYGNGLILHKVTSICPKCAGSAYSWELQTNQSSARNASGVARDIMEGVQSNDCRDC